MNHDDALKIANQYLMFAREVEPSTQANKDLVTLAQAVVELSEENGQIKALRPNHERAKRMHLEQEKELTQLREAVREAAWILSYGAGKDWNRTRLDLSHEPTKRTVDWLARYGKLGEEK